MSNKLFALLVLVIIFGFTGGFVYYFFFANAGDLEISLGDISAVQIELNSEYNAKLPSFDCNKICTLSNVPPVNYTLIATKEGYKKIIKNIKINKGETLKLKLNLEKEVFLNEIKNENKDKIEIIKYTKLLQGQKQEMSESSGDEKGGRVVLGIKEGILYYYKYTTDFTIYSFDSKKDKKLFTLENEKIKDVIFNKNDLLVIIKANDTSIFDIKSGIHYTVNINENILYTKKTISENKIIVTTDKGVYLYDLQNSSGIKNALFNDFIILGEDKILGVINSEDKVKISLLNFTDNNKDKLILHIISTRDKNLVYETPKNISYIELIDNKIVLTDREGVKFEINELKY